MLLLAGEVVGFHGQPVPRDARIDGIGDRQAAGRGILAEEASGKAGQLPALGAAVLDDGFEAFGIEIGKFGLELVQIHHTRFLRVRELFLIFSRCL